MQQHFRDEGEALSTGKVILATFAGRRDRMELLCRYARAAIARGLIDEWHVWDFTRNATDAAWLRREFPRLRMTPGDGLDYHDSLLRLRHGNGHAPASLRFGVAATNDLHLGLARLSGSGQSYEIVLGGWSNQRSVIRIYADRHALEHPALRPADEPAHTAAATPDVLPAWGFAQVDVSLDDTGLKVTLDGHPVIALAGPIAAGEFAILHRSGFGADAEWRFPTAAGRREFLFRCAPPRAHVAEAPYPFYLPFYRHYARLRAEYAADTFLKCDDDIVFLDLDGLQRFIAYRRRHPEYFLLSANIVNNGVCAYFQQEHGLIPRPLLDLELPLGGLFGSLWESARKAEILHDLFLRDPARFTASSMGVIDWRQRISINFIALLGSDLAHIPDIMWDDEDFLSHGGRARARKANAIFGPFCAAHLTFVAQDHAFDHARVLAGYAALARQLLPSEGAETASNA